jgi:D-alanine transaminase
VTHPLTHHILGGVTRDVVLDLCPELDIAVQERPILEEELGAADEVLLLGTTTGVMPVIQIEHHTIGAGVPGPITRKLQAVLHRMMLTTRHSDVA